MNFWYPLQLLADWLTYHLFQLKIETLLAKSTNFFIFETLKIFILLVVIIFTISIVRTFLPPEKIRRFLSRKHRFTGSILAALLGIITPFCSCSAVPLFLGFVESGVPLSTTFSFLVASPMINEVAIILLFGMFGIKVALIYIISGLIIAILAGSIIGKMKVEGLIAEFVFDHKIKMKNSDRLIQWKDRFDFAKEYTFDIIKKIWPYIMIGVGVGAWIHGYVPTDFLDRFAGKENWYAVPVAILVGIPLYSNAAGVIPLISVLVEKGVSIGTALAFMMAVTGLSLPEFLILKKVMKTKLILIFATVVGIGILITGFLFNIILK